jgi:autotransporter-associated beta strand protein
MNFDIRWSVKLLLATLALFPLAAAAQTLTITNGIQTYNALTNTTVTMTGRCELRLTTTNNPSPGCIINLTSPDAWVLLPNIRPSVVQASYLGQFLVNGVPAALNTNIRVVEYAMGTVVIPHSSSITPLQIFTGPNFLGASTNLALYTYYNTSTALGVFNQNIRSFRLKRGYMATVAQNANGTGASQVFVAQDADLDVGFLSANLSQPISFVRVFPWRWTAKKGWGGTQYMPLTDPLWSYDWSTGSASTVDREYLPMKWSSSSGTSSINNMQNTTCVLGYNEPDSATQANMTTNQAIADWPTMMQWGLRAGAPASSDSGLSGQGIDWTMNFMTLATNLGYRVDFVPVHWYKCGQSPAQLISYLNTVYAKFKRPMWVTEWNDGASWCTPLPADYNAEAAALTNFVTALENSPIVERYSIYSYWSGTAGTNLQLATGSGSGTLTPAGVAYMNLPSKVAYTQVWPPGLGRGIAQFHFETNTLDSSGYGNNGFAVADPNYVAGQVGQAVALDGTNSYIQLSPNVAQSNAFTFAAWVYWNGGANWQRIFDFGNDTSHYLYLSPSSGSGTTRFATRNGGTELTLDTVALPVGQWQHIAFTLSGSTAKIYTNGVLAASSASIVYNPSNIKPVQNYLGKSQTAADPLFNGSLDEVEIADYAFTAAQVAALLTNTAPQFVTNLIASVSSTQSIAYSSSIAGAATDADPGDTLTYSKISGPAWLNVAADGTLTGTPTPSDGGTNIFTVRVTDTAGASAFAGLTINTIALNANGVWNADANGLWSDTNNWSSGAVGNGAGFTADFSTINITADRTVTLDVSRSIGTLKFGDTSGSQSWILTSSGGSVLTLDTGSGTSPSVAVNQNTANISTSLAGLNGFTKSGAGTLTLSGTNTYSGTTIISAGTLNYNNPAAQTVSGIISGSGALAQSSGTLTLSANNTFTGGTTVNGGTLNLAIGGGTGAIRNNLTINPGAKVNLTTGDALGYTAGVCVTTVNIVGGTLTNSSGGNESYITTFNLTGGTISSGGGYYNLNGASAPINSLATNIVSTISAPLGLRASGLVISTSAGAVPGGVDLNISGVMADLQGSGFSWTKSGAGTMSLSGVNTNSGTATVSAGTLLVNGSIQSPATVANSATLGGKGVINGSVTIQSGGTLAPGTNTTSIGTLTVSNSVTLQAGSTNQMTIRKTAPMTNDVLRVTGTLTLAGTLTATNLSGTLAAGDSFKIFNAGSYNGGFTTFKLPTLGTGLGWNTTNLAVNGTLSVIATASPQFSSVAQRGDGNFQFSGTGAAGVTNELDAATNLFSPIVWLFVTNAVADQFGLFQLVDLQATNFSQRFYRIMAGP